ncbi:hypothetical protein Tco_0212187 [Tanacetum coccineum]
MTPTLTSNELHVPPSTLSRSECHTNECMMTNLTKYDLKPFITFMKTAGALVNPKGITIDSKCLYLIRNAVLEWHPHALVADDNLTKNLSLRNDTLLVTDQQVIDPRERITVFNSLMKSPCLHSLTFPDNSCIFEGEPKDMVTFDDRRRSVIEPNLCGTKLSTWLSSTTLSEKTSIELDAPWVISLS